VPRSFLFLQGPQSRFFERLGRALIARGHRVHRINLNLGDRLFWRLPATNFRGRFDDWPDFVTKLLEGRAVTDLLLLGDRRPYHIAAAEEARSRGVAVSATDFGYVRPDYLTLEAEGMTSWSRFPRDATAIRALAENFPEPNPEPCFGAPFRLLAACDIAYNAAAVLGRPLYPYYQRHGLYHPFAEMPAGCGTRRAGSRRAGRPQQRRRVWPPSLAAISSTRCSSRPTFSCAPTRHLAMRAKRCVPCWDHLPKAAAVAGLSSSGIRSTKG
jgi:capsular polysaccharide export protein